MKEQDRSQKFEDDKTHFGKHLKNHKHDTEPNDNVRIIKIQKKNA